MLSVCVEREFLRAKKDLHYLRDTGKNLWMAAIQMRWDTSFFNHQGSRYESSPFRDVLKFPFLEALESPADIQLKIHWFQQMLGDQCQNLPVQWPELCRMGCKSLLPPNVPLHTPNYHDCPVKCMRFVVLKPMAIAFWVVRGLLTIFPLLVCTLSLSFSGEQCRDSSWSTQDKGAAEIACEPSEQS